MKKHLSAAICMSILIGLLIGSNNAHQQTRIDYNAVLTSLSVEEKIDSARSLLSDIKDSEDGIALIKAVHKDFRKMNEPELQVDFYEELSTMDIDDSVKAIALKSAAALKRELHQNEASRDYYRRALAIHPERTIADKTSKLDIEYQIIVDDWFAGR